MPHTLHDVEPHHWYAIDEVRTLFREYSADLGIDLCFQGFEEELAALPGKYQAPKGALFLLRVGNVPAGCVALRPLDDSTCELKRLYVTHAFRSTGLGTFLLDAAMERALELGYKTMKLDTLARLERAREMYTRRGFTDCAPYNPNPEADICYLSKDLQTK